MTPPFPGGTSLSHLRVYDWPLPDGAGLAGSGTPHLHTASSEAYVVLAGCGSVQTLGPQGFAATALALGAVVWFTPGVVHRLVNDGDLELLVIMSDAGLPEAGDAVLTFPPDVLADVGRYRATAARARRDLALKGFATLRARVRSEGPSGLDDLYSAAARLVAERAPRWREIWSAGGQDQAAATGRALADLAAGVAPHLGRAAMASATPRPGPRRYGMCGRLQTWPL